MKPFFSKLTHWKKLSPAAQQTVGLTEDGRKINQERNVTQIRNKRHNLEKLGLCGYCGRPPVKGKRRCQKCIDRH